MSDGMLWQRREVILLFIDNLLFHLPIAWCKGVQMVERGSFVRRLGRSFGTGRAPCRGNVLRFGWLLCKRNFGDGRFDLLRIRFPRLRRFDSRNRLLVFLYWLGFTAKQRREAKLTGRGRVDAMRCRSILRIELGFLFWNLCAGSISLLNFFQHEGSRLLGMRRRKRSIESSVFALRRVYLRDRLLHIG